MGKERRRKGKEKEKKKDKDGGKDRNWWHEYTAVMLLAVKQRQRVRREGGRPEAPVQMELIYDA